MLETSEHEILRSNITSEDFLFLASDPKRLGIGIDRYRSMARLLSLSEFVFGALKKSPNLNCLN